MFYSEEHVESLREDNAVLRNRVADLVRERDEYKCWWQRDSKSLGAALNDLSLQRACKQDREAECARLRAALERHALWRKEALFFLNSVANGCDVEDEWPALSIFLRESQTILVPSEASPQG